MSKRALSNVSNNYQSQNNNQQTVNSLKRGIDLNENENSNITKKSKLNNDVDQENEKRSVFKKILSVNNRLIENITNSKTSSINKKTDKIVSIKPSNNIKKEFSSELINAKEVIKFERIKDEDVELIENLNKQLLEQEKKLNKIDFSDPINYYSSPFDLPDDIEDYDKKHIGDIKAEPQFAHDIFEYYFIREKQFKIKDYIDEQPEITRSMRAILVDWIVELQDTLGLNHETIYLSIKIVDHYLSKAKCSKSMFQLLGSTAVLIASKFETRFYAPIKNCLYVCDNAYTREQMIEMEKCILSKIDFNLGIPLSYRFLRRFARCAEISMETLTFARYILEMCLLEYEFCMELDSMMASACLLLVFKSKQDLNLKWTKTLEYYTHYKENDLIDLMNRINKFMHAPLRKSSKSIVDKYSSSVFFKVANNDLLPI